MTILPKHACAVATLLVFLAAPALWAVGPLHYRYDEQWGTLGSGEGQFNTPQKINVRADYVIVADMNNHRIQIFNRDGGFIAQHGTYGSGADNLGFPMDAEFDSAYNVYITELENDRVMKRTDMFSLGYVTQWGTSGSGAAQLDSPKGLAVDSLNEWVYVVDGSNSRISKWTTAGAHLLNFGTAGLGDGQFNSPSDVYAYGDYVYVMDTNSHRVQKFTTTGGYVTQWNGTAGGGALYYPDALTVGAGGFVFVADTLNNLIKKYTTSGGFVTSFGGEGTGNGKLRSPLGVAVDDSGRVFVSDSNNSRIQRFRLNKRPTNPTNLYITPNPRYDADNLAAHASGSTDGDADALSYRYAWYKSANNSAPWTKVKAVRILPANLTQANKWYRFQVHVWDGYDFSQWVTSTSVKVLAQPGSPALIATAQQTASRAIAINVTLSGAAQVEGQLCNLAGRTVAALPARDLAGGSSTIVLQAVSAHGTRLPAGQYLLELTARTQQGQTVSQLVPLSLR